MYTLAMLSLFPGILYLAPFSATILRLGAGVSFIYIGYALLMRRDELHKIRLPIIGHPPLSLIWIAGILTALDGLALLAGFGTQLAAIIGMLIALKHISLSGRWAEVRPFARSTYALLFLICLTLLVTGAGPLGFDLPL
jgi:uncharacterized membrane protein YphA (DoxX/SURF4 family)